MNSNIPAYGTNARDHAHAEAEKIDASLRSLKAIRKQRADSTPSIRKIVIRTTGMTHAGTRLAGKCVGIGFEIVASAFNVFEV